MIFEQIAARSNGRSGAAAADGGPGGGGAAGGGAAGPENLLRVSFLEIYNEELKDLLHPPALPSKRGPPAIAVRENAEGGIVLAGIKEEVGGRGREPA